MWRAHDFNLGIDSKSRMNLTRAQPEPNRKIKGNRTRIKSDLSGFSRILKTTKKV